MKNIGYIYLLLMAISTIAGCARETSESLEPTPAYQKTINWRVQSDNVQPGRALMNNTLLESSCTPATGGQSIGIWGDYTLENNNQTITTNVFNATRLVFERLDENTNPTCDWNYRGDPRYWEMGATYDFRACYPQDLMTSLMTQIDAKVLQGGPINTSTIQQDILVAATQVNTLRTDLTKPVDLKMEHIFAAIQFKVKAKYGYNPPNDEGVTSCWLQNQNSATDLFSPSGYLVYSGNTNPEITWYTYESSTAPMYVWKHACLPFQTENTLYIRNDGMTGSEYTTNDGWLLVVPQKVKAETLRFYYTLKYTGEQIYSVNIPAITYEHGKKYTYMLEISGSDVEISLTIAPWNKMDSSYDINL